VGKIANYESTVPPGRTVGLPAGTKDVDQPLSVQFLMASWARIANGLKEMAQKMDDVSRPVDEYQASSFTESVTTLEVMPQFDQFSERISAILVTGPPAGVFNLKLGDREWLGLVIPNTGIITIPNISLWLSRHDRRVLTSVTAGDWNLELMGYADVRSA
jgi:hypothetical protein